MREALEMVTASLMQNMVQIQKKNDYFETKFFFIEILEKVILGLSALRAPTVGPFSERYSIDAQDCCQYSRRAFQDIPFIYIYSLNMRLYGSWRRC